MDDFGLIKTADRFGESVVVTVANASDRRLYACLRQLLRIANGYILRAAVGTMDEAAALGEAWQYCPRYSTPSPSAQKADGPPFPKRVKIQRRLTNVPRKVPTP